MHIFIDESGTFSGIGNSAPALSALGALVIPDHKIGLVLKKYRKLRPTLSTRKGEVKGSLLSESQVASVVTILRVNGCIFTAAATDMALHSLADIKSSQASRVASLAANLHDGHTPELRNGVAQLQARLKKFSPQLYMQLLLTVELLHRVMNEAIVYHCQRNPKELAKFHWIIDGKEAHGVITNWEDWWSNTIVVWLQALSLVRPGNFLSDGDYHHLDRFFMELPRYLTDQVKPDLADKVGLNLQLIFRESFRFSSDPEPGLELVDIITNALRRGLVGNLGDEGWLPIRTIMIHRSECYIALLGVTDTRSVRDQPYNSRLNHFKQGGRNMMTDRRYEDLTGADSH